MSRSSIIAMTNHMIIMVCESDSCMFVFTCIMQIAITIFDTITIRYPTTSDLFYHNVLLSMPYHVEMLLPKRSSLHFFFFFFFFFFFSFLVYRYHILIVVNSKPSQGLSLITTTNQTILNVRCTYMIRSYTCHVIS